MANLKSALPDIAVSQGSKTLSDKIANGDFLNFASVCECIVKILEALKPIHEKGFLHLGISPDTVRFSDAGVAQLTGFTEAFRMGDDFQNWAPAFQAGYSARELIRHPLTKPLSINCAADLYSVTAIFFRLLVGRAPKDDDWSDRGKWRLDNSKKGYLKGASGDLVEETNDFLRKGLSLTAARRFSDIGEMRKGLEKLIRQGQK